MMKQSSTVSQDVGAERRSEVVKHSSAPQDTPSKSIAAKSRRRSPRIPATKQLPVANPEIGGFPSTPPRQKWRSPSPASTGSSSRMSSFSEYSNNTGTPLTPVSSTESDEGSSKQAAKNKRSRNNNSNFRISPLATRIQPNLVSCSSSPENSEPNSPNGVISSRSSISSLLESVSLQSIPASILSAVDSVTEQTQSLHVESDDAESDEEIEISDVPMTEDFPRRVIQDQDPALDHDGDISMSDCAENNSSEEFGKLMGTKKNDAIRDEREDLPEDATTSPASGLRRLDESNDVAGSSSSRASSATSTSPENAMNISKSPPQNQLHTKARTVTKRGRKRPSGVEGPILRPLLSSSKEGERGSSNAMPSPSTHVENNTTDQIAEYHTISGLPSSRDQQETEPITTPPRVTDRSITEDAHSPNRVPQTPSDLQNDPDVGDRPLERFHKETMGDNAIKNKILEKIRGHSKKASGVLSKDSEKDDGFIYVFESTLYNGYVKIGRTKNPIGDRMKQWGKCEIGCIYIEDSENAKFRHYVLVENLIHTELSNYRRIFKCKRCGIGHMLNPNKHESRVSHGEWFEIDKDKALEVVERWRRWAIEQEPYTLYGELRDFWDKKCDEAAMYKNYDLANWHRTNDSWIHEVWSYACFWTDERIKTMEPQFAVLANVQVPLFSLLLFSIFWRFGFGIVGCGIFVLAIAATILYSLKYSAMRPNQSPSGKKKK